MKYALLLFLVFLVPVRAHGQTQISSFAADPSTCSNTRGLLYYNTTSFTMKQCGPTVNTWTALATGAGISCSNNNSVIYFTSSTFTCDANFTYGGAGQVTISPTGSGSGIGLQIAANNFTNTTALPVPLTAVQTLFGASTFGNTAGISSTITLNGAVTVGTISAFQAFGNPATGNATAMHAFHATTFTPRSGGNLGTAVGFYAEAQTSGQGSNFGFFSAAGNTDQFANLSAVTYSSVTNCAAVGSAASPSVAACSAAPAGSFSCATNASTGNCQVNTTAVTANSEIFVQEDDSLGTRLGVTCNVNNVLPASAPLLGARSAGASFTVNLGTFTANPLCFSYHIIN